jgi:hypothetical protein
MEEGNEWPRVAPSEVEREEGRSVKLGAEWEVGRGWVVILGLGLLFYPNNPISAMEWICWPSAIDEPLTNPDWFDRIEWISYGIIRKPLYDRGKCEISRNNFDIRDE